jgi:toxin CcdB
MARFDVYASPDRAGYLLDIQADLLANLNTRIVVPLLPVDAAPKPAQRLNPVFRLGETDHVMVTQFLSAVRVAILGRPVSTLIERDVEIVAALDLVLSGI